MAQLYSQTIIPPKGWILGGPEGATQLLLLAPASVQYGDGTSDALPALTPAVLPDGVTTQFDRGQAVYVAYTVKGSGALSVIAESDLGTLMSDYAPLGRVLLHGVAPYQPSAYLGAGGLGSAASTTVTIVSSAGTVKALTLGNGGTPPADWQATGFDDSAWVGAVTANTNAPGYPYPPPPGAAWVWSENPPAAAPEQALFRHHFSLPAGRITGASLALNADDSVTSGYLNGTQVAALSGPATTGQFQVTTAIPLDTLVAGGSNVLALEGINPTPPSPNPTAGVAYTLTVTYAASGDVATDPTTDEGDLSYRHEGTLARLPIGATGALLASDGSDPTWLPVGGPGQVLTVVSGVPSWAAAAGGGGGGGAMALIASTTLAAAAAAITFSAIPGTYAQLLCIFTVRATGGSAAFQNMWLQMNGDTGADYQTLGLDSGGSYGSSDTTHIITGYVDGGGATAGSAAGGEIWLPWYAGTSFWKTANTRSYTGNSLNRTNYSVGAWHNTAAITELTFFLDANMLAAGSSIALYGIS